MKIKLDKKQTKEFRRIKFSQRQQFVQGHFPDFLIIGPQRTGTTWLAKQIRNHPEVFMTFPKELYFFSRLGALHSRHYDHFNWKSVIKKPNNGIRELAKICYFDLIRTGSYSANQLQWYLEFFKEDILQRIVNKNIRGNKAKYDLMVKGEATASYATLDSQIIREIKLLNPQIKAILMIRDPVSRSWSHAKKDLLRNPGKTLSQISKDTFYEFFKNPYQISANSYEKNIDRWSSIIGKNNLFIGRFEHIEQQPWELLSRIYRFLGVSVPKQTGNPSLYQKVNLTNKDKIPEQFESFLTKLYRTEIEFLNHQYPV